jgi:hypothetical protein
MVVRLWGSDTRATQRFPWSFFVATEKRGIRVLPHLAAFSPGHPDELPSTFPEHRPAAISTPEILYDTCSYVNIPFSPFRRFFPWSPADPDGLEIEVWQFDDEDAGRG